MADDVMTSEQLDELSIYLMLRVGRGESLGMTAAIGDAVRAIRELIELRKLAAEYRDKAAMYDKFHADIASGALLVRKVSE